MADPLPAIGRHPAVLAVPELRWIPIIRVITTITIIRWRYRLWHNDTRGSSSIRKRPDHFRQRWTSIRHFLATIAAPPQRPASTGPMKTVTITTNSTWKPVPSTVATPRAITLPSTSTVASKLSRLNNFLIVSKLNKIKLFKSNDRRARAMEVYTRTGRRSMPRKRVAVIAHPE